MPGTYVKKSTGWNEILSIYVKKSTGWIEILNAYVKKSTGWLKIFSRGTIPGILTTPKVRDINGNNFDNVTFISNVGDTLVGYRGTWSNSPVSYEYRWMYSTIENGTLSPFSPAQAGTFSGTTTNLVTQGATTAQVNAWNDKYVYIQVRATNASGTSDWVTSSNFAHVIKYAPFIYDAKMFRASTELTSSVPVSSGQSITGTYTEITDPDQISDVYLYEWLYADNTLSPNNTGTVNYSISANDVGKQLKFRVTGSNTGGEGTAESNLTATVVAGYPGYTFNMGNVLHVGTNGYIGLNSGSASTSIPTTGAVIAIQVGDFVITDLRKWSDGNRFVIIVDSYRYNFLNQAAYRFKYQILFDTTLSYADYRVVSIGSSITTMAFFGMYFNGALVGSAYPGPFVYGNNTTVRVYFSGAAPTAFVGMINPPDAAAIQIPLTPTAGSADDGYFSITTSTNQYALPFTTLGPASATSNGISANSSASGNDFQYQSYVIRTGSHSGPVALTGTVDSPNFFVSGLSSGIRYYVTTTPVNSLSQTGTPYQFDIQTTSAPGAFNITSVTKLKGSVSGGVRQLTVNWGASTNATKYEFAIQGSINGSTDWTTLVFDPGDGFAGTATWDLPNSPYYDYGTGTKTFNNVPYYPYYRVSMRARGADLNLANAAYSNGGTSSFLSYVNATGAAPDKPTLTTPSGSNLTATSVSIPFTFPTNTGSNFIDWIQFSTDQINWSNDFTSPYTFTTTANTSYTVYARSLNYDGLTSSTPHNSVTFTTPQSLAAPTSLSATTTTSTGITLTFSGGFGDSYEVFYNNANSATDTTSYTRPTNATAADFNGITSSPFNTGLTSRGVHRRFWIRSRITPNASVWYPDGNGTVGAGIYGYAPLYAPGTVGSLTNTAQSTTSLSFTWTAPTSNATQDAATSYDYAISTSTSTPSFSNNTTVVPTAGAPLVITGLSSNTTYYLHVRAKNSDATGSSTFVSGTTSQTVSIPAAPSPSWGNLTYAGSSLTTTLSPSAAGNSTKTQSWSYSNTVTFPVSWSAVSGATSYDYFFSASSTAPTSTTTPTGNTTSLSFSLTGSQSNRGTITRYAWVRARNSAGASAWTGTGARTSGQTTISSFVIRLYRSGSTTIFTTGAPTGGSTTTALSYAYTGVSTSFAHYATASGIIGGTNLSASSA